VKLAIVLVGIIIVLSAFLSLVLLENQHLESEYERISSQYMEIIKSESFCIAQEGHWSKTDEACY
jgi:hypothetical protein